MNNYHSNESYIILRIQGDGVSAALSAYQQALVITESSRKRRMKLLELEWDILQEPLVAPSWPERHDDEVFLHVAKTKAKKEAESVHRTWREITGADPAYSAAVARQRKFQTEIAAYKKAGHVLGQEKSSWVRQKMAEDLLVYASQNGESLANPSLTKMLPAGAFVVEAKEVSSFETEEDRDRYEDEDYYYHHRSCQCGSCDD